MFFAVDEEGRQVAREKKGIMKRVGKLAEENHVSIHAMLQTRIEDTTTVSFVITTHPCTCVVLNLLECGDSLEIVLQD